MVEDKEDKRRSGRGWTFYATLILASLVLYLASLGPAVAIFDRGGPKTRYVIEIMFVPADVVANWTGTEYYLGQYVNWWHSLAAQP
jgi:hypothetical protein